MAEFVSDATLLNQFVSHREEAAFVALVRRHGPRVERICRRILRNDHDVEDVLQATFLVLARKAAGIPWCDSISPWIDAVARRLAMHARSGAVRQQGREVSVTALVGVASEPIARLPERYHPVVEPSAELERRDLRRILDDELRRLPEKYRAPVVLCDLEGHTSQEAARRLGWPAGSMSRRLQRARTLLRRRLTHRGLALAAIGLASAAIAAAAIGLGPVRSPRTATVPQVMAPFKPVLDGGEGFGTILTAAARAEGSAPDFARVLPAAREAAVAARRLEDHDAGRLAPLWRQYVGEMERSAVDLERACQESDSLNLLMAARRLNASCLNCHAVFRQGATRPALPTEATSFRSSPAGTARRSLSLQRAATIGERGRRLHPTDVRSLTLAARFGSKSPILSSGIKDRSDSRAAFDPIRRSKGVASNERVGAAVEVAWAPPTEHRRRFVGSAPPISGQAQPA